MAMAALWLSVGRCEFKPMLKAPGFTSALLRYDEPLSSFAFNFNVCPNVSVIAVKISLHAALAKTRVEDYYFPAKSGASIAAVGRGLNSSTFRLNVSACCGTGGAFRGCSGGV